MENLEKQWALITGATSGIGLELAKLFAADKYNLVIVARKQEELNDSAALLSAHGIEVVPIQKDLSIAGHAEQLYAEIKQKGIVLDVVVNNAGFGEYGSFHDIALEKDLEVITLNMTSLTVLTKLALNDMLYRHSGKILNVASTAAFQPGPLMALYYASKAYVLSLSEALTNELVGTGITVTTFCPGPTKTGFQKRSEAPKNVRLYKLKHSMSAERVAQIGYDGLMSGQGIVIPGLRNKLLVQSLRLAPRKLVLKIVRYIDDIKK